ncbi:hypothetical protein X975_09013, partial [Stegodyphus mimosarum]
KQDKSSACGALDAFKYVKQLSLPYFTVGGKARYGLQGNMKL